MELLEIVSVSFDVTDQLLIRFSALDRYWRKMGVQETAHHLLIYFKKTCDSFRRNVLYSILIVRVTHEASQAD
jgi:hypothetical protein